MDKGEYAAYRSPGGLGICPDPGERNACDESGGLDDGESPHVAYNQESIECSGLELCVALSEWSPWEAPSESLLRAMAMVQRARGHVTTVDTTTTCMRRAEAVPAVG